MNKILLVLMLLLISSCGNLVLVPRGCRSEGKFASKSDELTKEKTFEYNVFMTDKEIRLNSLMECQKVDLLKVTITKKFFVKYYVTLKFNENFKEEK